MMRRRALLAAPVLLGAGRAVAAATPIARLETAWWKARHDSKLAELRAVNPALLWLGDSITQNFERDGPEPWARFRPIWERFYAPHRAVNLGFKGDATCHLLWRLTHGELDGIRPKAAILLIGANNLGRLHWSAEDSVAGISAILAVCRQRQPQMRVLLVGVLPSERGAWASETTLAINATLAARHPAGVAWFDPTALFLSAGRLDRSRFYDPLLAPPEPPLHPTAQAQLALAEAIAPRLSALLA
jgi:hypothetical protein